MLNLRLGGAFAGIVSLLAALLVGLSPATAATSDSITLTTPVVAIDSSGNAQVWARCNRSTTCTGAIAWDEVTRPEARLGTSYSIPARSSKYIKVRMKVAPSAVVSQYDPYSASTSGRVKVGAVWQVSNARIQVRPSGSNPQQVWTTNVQTKFTAERQTISGTVVAAAGTGTMTNVKVELFRPVKGGSQTLYDTDTIGTIPAGSTRSYSLITPKVPFVNNVSTVDYRVRISGVDDQQQGHEWWWRGSTSNTFSGGARYIRTASAIKPSVSPITANFRYGSVAGTAKLDNVAVKGLSVSAVAAPHDFNSGMTKTVLRELDVEHCGDEYARVRTSSSGAFRMDFVPAPASGSENKYLVYARQGVSEGWNKSATGLSYGSCYQALDYGWTRQGMQLGSGGSVTGVQVNVVTQEKAVAGARIDLRTSKFSDSRAARYDYSDQWVMFRRIVPGLARNGSPVVLQGMAKDSEPTDFKLPPGRYWVETGRRGANCARWYPSVYPDNNAYLKGEDRGAERWKTVAGKYAEYQKSYDMGYVAKTPPSGYKGWMYREYCKTISRGWIGSVDVPAGSSGFVSVATPSVIKAGAVVSGKVTRSGGRSNKEMMVRLSSTNPDWGVIRADLTDSKGKFYVAGLPDGTYRIEVNPDSWRGIGRSFTGTKTITVKAGQSYGVGTLYFSG